MSTRVKDVIAKIYRPPSEGRRAFAHSRGDAERVPLIHGVVMISITAPEEGPAQLPEYEHLLCLSFADIDFLSKELSSRAAEKLPAAMTPADAERILQLVQTLPATVHSLVVHCEGGYSRSAGVVLALKVLYGYEVEDARLGQANQSVVKTLIDKSTTGERKRRR